MSTNLYLLLIVLLGFINAGCVPQNANVNTQPTETGSTVTNYREQMRKLMVNQNYQEALDLMPKVEKETLGKGSPDEVFGEQEGIQFAYYFLYMALGRDKDALQKMMEYQLPHDIRDLIGAKAASQLEFKIYLDKITVMSRLNMMDDFIRETIAIFDNHSILNAFAEGVGVPRIYEELLILLASAQIIQGDMESAQETINRVRNLLDNSSYRALPQFDWTLQPENTFARRRVNSPILEENETESMPKFRPEQIITLSGTIREQVLIEGLLLYEYYMHNLTATHTLRFSKNEPEPPKYTSDKQDKISFKLPRIEYEIVSKTDGSLFTFEDLRKATAVPVVDPFPVIDPFFEQENCEDATESK